MNTHSTALKEINTYHGLYVHAHMLAHVLRLRTFTLFTLIIEI